MEIGLNEFDRNVGVQVIGWNNVQHSQLRDLVRMIERHSMRNTATAVVTNHGKTIETEMFHHLNLIERHGAFRIIRMVFAVRRLAAVAISAKIRSNDGIFCREFRSDNPPGAMPLESTIQ